MYTNDYNNSFYLIKFSSKSIDSNYTDKLILSSINFVHKWVQGQLSL